MFTEKNIVSTSWNTMFGVVGNNFPLITDGNFTFPKGSSPIVHILGTLPASLYSAKSEPEQNTVYISTGTQTIGVDQQKLVEMAERLHKENGLTDEDYNISVDYTTGTLFSAKSHSVTRQPRRSRRSRRAQRQRGHERNRREGVGRMKAIAKVQVLLDVHLTQPWSETETMQYIREAATREAKELIECTIQARPNIHVARIQQITISVVEEP